MRILVVNPTATQSLGTVGSALTALGCQIDQVASADVEALIDAAGPDGGKADGVALLDHSAMAPGVLLPLYDGLVVLGGGFSVRSVGPTEGRAPPAVIAEIEELVLSFHSQSKPVLGICLGSQLIARAFGADVFKLPADEEHTAYPAPGQERAPRGQEFGFLPVEVTAEGRKDSVVGPALENSGATIFEEWHEDSFELPDGAALLTTRPKGARNQAFRVGEKTYAFQYHIEVGETLAKEWHDGWAADQGLSGVALS